MSENSETVNTNTNSNSTLTQEEREKQAEDEMKRLLNEMRADTGTSAYHIKRLLNSNFINPYEVLLLKPDASEEEIKKQYRQLSLLVHPDKCQEENAADAFHGIYILT
jgi:DnaJ family protein C protein 8